VLRRFAVLIALIAVLGAALGALIEANRGAGSVATIRMFANSKRADNALVSQTTSLALQRMNSYVRLADSTVLASRLEAKLNLDTSAQELANRISASVEKDTVIMTVTVSAKSDDEARAIADALPAEFTSVVNQLVDAPSTDSTATTFSTVDGPFVRSGSSPSRLLLSVVFGLVVGGALGLALALALARRSSGRSPEALASMTGLPVVGIVPDGSRVSGDRHAPDAPLEAQRLAYHRLARNLTHLASASHRLVVVCSAQAGSGATATAVGVSKALAQRGDRVLLVDAAFDAAGYGTTGVQANNTVGDVLAGKVSVREAIVADPGTPNLEVLTLGTNRDGQTGTDQRGVRGLLSSLGADYDTIVVDATPILAQADLPMAMGYADAILFVVDQHGTSREETIAAADGLRAMGAGAAGLVVNHVRAHTVSPSQMQSGAILAPRSGDVAAEALAAG